MTRVRGHALQGEGKPFFVSACGECQPDLWWSPRAAGYGGHGLCECGAVSLCLDSDAARKRWHRAHKDDVRGEGNE